ncbi:MAG: RNA polymerase-binding protein DksA [Gammaproteobacteria bacterium]|nr:RNA polymerase-binding protein DksA [Gammaproteobacteria bacterium]
MPDVARAAKKTSAKKTAPAAKKKAAAKPAGKPAGSAKATPKKAATKAAPAKKAAAKKSAAKKAPAAKKAVSKTTKKAAPAKKPAAKAAVKKAAPKKPAAKPVASKKTTAKKAPAKATTAAASKAATAKKTAGKSAAAKPAAASTRKQAPGKAAAGKATAAKNSSTATGQVAAGVASTRTTPNRPVPADESAPTMRTRMINLEDVTLPSGYLPSPSEEYMCPRQLLYFRNKLMQWRDELIAESQETLDHLRSEIRDVGDEAERASRESDNILELRTRDRYRKLLNKIDAAMKRIEDGSYGYCEETGEEIGLGRLEARPIATLTVDAQERREMLQRQFRDDR